MNNRICSVCGVEYDASNTNHVCGQDALEAIFQDEQRFDGCLNSNKLAAIKIQIAANGNPAELVAMWEKLADSTFND